MASNIEIDNTPECGLNCEICDIHRTEYARSVCGAKMAISYVKDLFESNRSLRQRIKTLESHSLEKEPIKEVAKYSDVERSDNDSEIDVYSDEYEEEESKDSLK